MNTRTKKLFAVWMTAAMLIGTTATAVADHDYRVARNDRAVFDYARVISSKPIVNYVTVKTPVRECWEEMQYYTIDRRGRHASGSTLVGALIGGVVGHQFGGGSGKDAATVAGTLIGAAIGSDASRQHYNGRGIERVARPVERCETRYQSHREKRIDGYSVTYRYNGQRYRTEMPYDPGRRIRVRIDVRPAA